MNDDLVITSGLDQALPVNNEWQLHRIEEIIHNALDKKDPLIIMDALKEIVEVMKLGGIILAKSFYLLHKYWDDFDTADDFNEIVFDYTGLHSYTVERYIRVWAIFAENHVPEDLEETIMQKNIRDLIPAANAINQGYEIDDDSWREIARSPDFQSVSRFVREKIKNQAPRSNQLTLMLRRDGTIVAYMDGQQENVAWVDLTNKTNIVQKSVNRLLDGAGVIKQ